MYFILYFYIYENNSYLNTLILDGLTSFALMINTGNRIENRQPLETRKQK